MTGPTIRDVARAAEVSVATVSRTLNGLGTVAALTRDRVIRAAGELDYIPHSGARSLSTRRTDTIGVLLPDVHGEYFSELIRGIDVTARAHGLHLLLSSSHGDPEEAMAALRAMRSRVDAMIVMLLHAGEEIVLPGIGSTPLVLLGSGLRGGAHPSLGIDNFAGAFAITRHIQGLGRRRIAFVAGPHSNIEARERLRGYRAALVDSGIAECIVEGDFSEGSGFDAARDLLRRAPPDAVFCANDVMAIGCLEAFRKGGVSVPDEVAVAGFDDIPIARYVNPPLTTAAVPIAEIGRQALQCCIDRIAGRECAGSRTFNPDLVVRASTAGTMSGAAPANQRGI